MVVFQDAMPKKAHYRKFAVRGLDGQDDFAAMAEVISRRFARLGGATQQEYDEGFAAAPNLVVIDGGKGQLSAALAAMQAYDLPRVAVIALAKRIEEVFVPGRPDAILLDPHSAGLQLLQRIRDEAHRFALGFHRQRRDAQARESLFDTLEGVGPARRRALLRHFGSAESVAGGERRRSSRACRACPRRPPAGSTSSCTRPAAARSSPGPKAPSAGRSPTMSRQRTWPSVRKSAVKPTITFTVISVSFMPTEKASSRLRGTAPLNTKTMNACSVPIPPGEIGTSVARLCVTWTRKTLRRLWSTLNAPRKNQIATKRSVQSAACHAATLRRYSVRSRRDGEALPHALLELVDVEAGPEEADDAEDHERGEQDERELRVGREEAEVEAGQPAERVRAGQHPERERVGEDQRAATCVEDRQHEQRRGERRVRAARARRDGRGRA